MSRRRFAPRRFAGALFALALTFWLTISISLHAQVAGTGTIQGIVTDPTGAFVPGATVTLTEESTHVVRTAKTDSAGAYVFPNIVVGTYSLTVADAGFQTYSSIHNVLEVGSNIGIDAHLALELHVRGRGDVAQHRVGDVGVDVERGRARGPVARALLAADRPPRERGALEPQVRGVGLGDPQCRMPPAQGVRRGAGLGEHEDGEHERLGVPQTVAVVALPGEALRADRPLLGAGAGLEHVEQGEADGLLEARVAVDLVKQCAPDVHVAISSEEHERNNAIHQHTRGSNPDHGACLYWVRLLETLERLVENQKRQDD